MKSLSRAFLALALITVLPFAAIPAAEAEEVITSFASDVRLSTDGSVQVIETISVWAEGVSIHHGIYRDIPTVMINQDGSKLYSDLTIHAIKRGDRTESYHTEGITNGLRIYIGDADIYLSPGLYTYTIDYSMTRMGRRFADHDELYWNATGNYWDFPIENAVARVTLPEGAVISDLQGYTGGYGSTEQAVTITREANNRAIFRATRALHAYEGMTVSASFQKGILTEPSATEGTLNYLSDHRSVLLPGVGALLVLIYNFWAWFKVGRDPAKGTIIPLFHPPKEFSPALTHYVHRMGWKKSGWLAFTAGLIDLAVKGLLVLGKDGKKNTIAATHAPVGALPPEEHDLLSYFSSRGTVTVDKKTGPQLAKQMSAFKKAALGTKGNIWFRNNFGYVALSFLVSILVLGVMIWAGVIDPVVVFITIFVAGFLTIFVTAFGGVLSGSGFTRVFLFIWAGLFVVNAGGGLIVMVGDALNDISLAPSVLALLTIVVINALFGVLMRAPTVEGRKVMDEIDGFRMYLETAEKERLNFQNEPQMTVTRFESILPYAVALGVEKPWTERFENDLARNAVSDFDGTDYHPVWYGGSSFRSGSMSRDVAAFATGMSAAMIAAQPASSSSSGGGGGGSSGGGGGGGGGGGW